MKILKSAIAIIICLAVLVLSSCSNLGNIVTGTKTLNVGVENIEGIFNPFYASCEADKQIVSQIFQSIQRRGSDNKLINYGGAISYEFVESGKVKYTVTIRDDMKFSDGTDVKIDDIIFFYHFIADASYDGVYKNWYQNDIVGLKEYYYDDINYKSKLEDIEYNVLKNYSSDTIDVNNYKKYLTETSLEGKFSADAAPDGTKWKDYFSKNSFEEKYKSLGKNPTDEQLLALAAEVEASLHPDSYDPSEYFYNKLIKEYIKKSYENGTSVSSISGIKKINDYTCTILFNSKNINSISEINATIVSKAFYSVNYIKGTAEKVKEINDITMGSGPYILSQADDDEVVLDENPFYYSDKPGFGKLKFIDIAAKKIDPIKGVNTGKIDIASTPATAKKVSEISKNDSDFILTYDSSYLSLFFNTRTLNDNKRKVLFYACNFRSLLEFEIGSYYIDLLRPLSVRFSEYPSNASVDTFEKTTLDLYMNTVDISKLNAYYCGNEDDIEYKILFELKSVLAEYNITLNIVSADKETIDQAVEKGKADIWLERIYDGATCDKYDNYNSKGKLNKTGIKNADINDITSTIRSSVGLSDRSKNTEALLDLIYKSNIEYPVYQQQIMTVYNKSVINSESINDRNNYDGMTYILPHLMPM